MTRAEIKKLDSQWSLKVKNTKKCALCNRTKYLQAHHMISKGFRPLRFDIKNGICLCYYHHLQVIHRNTIVGAELIKEAIGTRRYNWLLKQYNSREVK